MIPHTRAQTCTHTRTITSSSTMILQARQRRRIVSNAGAILFLAATLALAGGRPGGHANASLATAGLLTGEKPHLSGIFLAINDHSANWTLQQWTQDLGSMRAVGIRFVALAKLLHPVADPSPACPLGNYTAYFSFAGSNGTGTPPSCVQQHGGAAAGSVVGTVLQAARAVGLRVHLGLASYEALYRNGGSPWTSVNTTRSFAYLQATAARALHARHGSTGLIDGFYTEVGVWSFVRWHLHTVAGGARWRNAIP